jgi:hypothetical protein
MRTSPATEEQQEGEPRALNAYRIANNPSQAQN